MSQYHSTLCGCIYDVDASYNWMDQQVEVDAVVISHICNKHLPGNNSRLMDENAILREQNRQLREALEAAKNALRSYQYGNQSAELAEEVANHIEALAATAPAGEE